MMDLVLETVLNCIPTPCRCIVDGEERLYETGLSAANAMQDDKANYRLISLTAEYSHVVVTIRDVSEDIKAKNHDFDNESLRQYGRTPSFFE